MSSRPLFRKVLIANRGEIAVRVARGLRDLGIGSVAVYSDPDRTSLHVRAADEAIAIGPAAAAESYLNLERLLDAARATGASAVHPGYGFLSENAGFAQAVIDAGLVWIGPSPKAMIAVSDKISARRMAAAAGVPIVPGSAALEDQETANAEAARIGFPLLVKASAGGGGKGMRVATTATELASALRAARSEGKASFGRDTVYLERLIEAPRHIEIQILGDRYGNVVHLGERECSVQRRHQKVLEESPSPGLDAKTRSAMGAAAVAAARAAGYENAGTCEFLLDRDGRFYFLEVNARLQVEHPVTELVTGLDLVGLQVRVAAGEPLPFAQEDIQHRGHAIEVRIYAEDPARGFLPSPGVVRSLREPSGPGVRVDSGIALHSEVTSNYDPILAKLIVWGADRPQAISRLERALAEYRIGGLTTNLSLHRQIVLDPRFLSGTYDTSFLTKLGQPSSTPESDEVVALATALHRVHAEAQQLQTRAPGNASGWKRMARANALRAR